MEMINEVHQKGTASHILWFSDWLHNTSSAGSSIFVANHNTRILGQHLVIKGHLITYKGFQFKCH